MDAFSLHAEFDSLPLPLQKLVADYIVFLRSQQAAAFPTAKNGAKKAALKLVAPSENPLLPDRIFYCLTPTFEPGAASELLKLLQSEPN